VRFASTLLVTLFLIGCERENYDRTLNCSGEDIFTHNGYIHIRGDTFYSDSYSKSYRQKEGDYCVITKTPH
jgi:hypothetical protein